MTRIICTVLAFLFLTACGGGTKTKLTTPEHIRDRIEEVLQADPVFLGSHPLIVQEDGGTFELKRQTCNEADCSLDEQETTLAALLGADGFKPAGAHRGVSLGTGELEHFEGEIIRYGGWLKHSAFAVHSGVLTDGEPGFVGYIRENIIHAYTVGGPSGTNPEKSATWTGVVLAADIDPNSQGIGNFVRGSVTLTADLDAVSVDVLFENMTDIQRAIDHGSMAWSQLPLVSGAFERTMLIGPEYDQHRVAIEGTFYGSDHAEAGGIFTRDGFHGAFGVSRK